MRSLVADGSEPKAMARTAKMWAMLHELTQKD